MINRGLVTINGNVASKGHRVQPAEVVEVRLDSRPEPSEPGPHPIVKFEDDQLAVVSKPPGLLTHRAPGGTGASLVDAISARMPLATGAGEGRAGIVHRLDKDTSGLLVVAKTDAAYEALASMMRGRSIKRFYKALVAERFSMPTGRIEAPMGRSRRDPTKMEVAGGGRSAVTHFSVLEEFRTASLVEVRLATGRTHQIRVHFSHIKHPVVGDRTYGRPASELARELGLARPFLHAFRLQLPHPMTGELVDVEDELPSDLQGALERARILEGMAR
jgi:23S rRNA pseudouridine1911/1915/1917 synthase